MNIIPRQPVSHGFDLAWDYEGFLYGQRQRLALAGNAISGRASMSAPIPDGPVRNEVNDHTPSTLGSHRQILADVRDDTAELSEVSVVHASTSFRRPEGDDNGVQSGPNFLSDLPKSL